MSSFTTVLPEHLSVRRRVVALLNTVAACPEAEICAFRRDPAHVVLASSIGRISSFNMGGWSDPLGVLLQEVMLDGVAIHPKLEHDRDVPRYHDVERTRSLATRIDLAMRAAPPPSTDPNSLDDWIRSELSAAYEVVRTAAQRRECVVTAWEVIGGVHGVPMHVRLLGPAEQGRVRTTSAALRPFVIAGVMAGALLGIAVWRERRTRRLRPGDAR
jgi:hypothetical protein